MDSKSVKCRLITLFILLSTAAMLILSQARCATDEEQVRLNFTERLWNENYGTYQAILSLPFIRGVADGTLPAEEFRYYIIQDYLYLQNYRNVFKILLSKAPDERAKEFITCEIQGIDEEIENVHLVYSKKYNITSEELANAKPNQTTQDYNAFLTETATEEPFPVGFIATLPCNWIYYRVADDIKNAGYVKNNPYQEWIDAYSSTLWEETDTREFVYLVEYYMVNNEHLRGDMEQAFNRAFEYEYMFWKESQGGTAPF